MPLEYISPSDFYLIIDAEIQEKSLVNHHLVSFDTFVEVGMEQIVTSVFKLERVIHDINRNNPKDADTDFVFLEITFTEVYISSPTTINPSTNVEEPLTPLMAIRRELMYEGSVHVDATIRAIANKKDGKQVIREEFVKNQFLLKIPIMVKSTMCHLRNLTQSQCIGTGEDPDCPGGYFIVNGQEKVVECVENTAYNIPRIFISNYEKEYIRCEMISQPGDYFLNSEQFILRWNKDKTITVEIHRDAVTDIRIPFYMLYRLMDWTSDKMIFDHVLNEDYESALSIDMQTFLIDAFNADYGDFKVFDIHKKSELLELYARKAYDMNADKFKYLNVDKYPDNWLEIYKYVQKRICENFLPHLGKEEQHNSTKLRFISDCIRNMYLVNKGIMRPTDRDSYDTKRVAAAGDTFAKVFKNSFNESVIKTVRKRISNEFASTPFDNINFPQLLKSILFNTEFSKNMRQSFNPKNKGKVANGKLQVNRMSSQPVTRKNETNTLSTLRTIAESRGASATTRQSERAIEMREQHPTTIGYVCLGQSPLNGDRVGLTKQCAISMSITKTYSSEQMKQMLREDTEDIIPYDSVHPRKIFDEKLIQINVNGYPIGFTRDAYKLCTKYRKLRRRGKFAREISVIISHQFGTVVFQTDANRPIRPLVIVYNTERDPEMLKDA